MATKGVCAICGLSVAVRKDGLVRAHGYPRDGDPSPKEWCPGSSQEPKLTTDHGAFSALCALEDDLPTLAIVWVEDSWLPLCARHARRALK